MERQDLKKVFDDLRDDNDFGYRGYRIAECLAPRTGTGAPSMNALFLGQVYVDTTPAAEKFYMAKKVGSATPADDWQEVTMV